MSANYTNDQTVVQSPDAPGDCGEIFDYVLRKGPISYSKISDATGWMSPNDIYSALHWCIEHGVMESEVDFEEHGTTEKVYYVPERMEGTLDE